MFYYYLKVFNLISSCYLILLNYDGLNRMIHHLYLSWITALPKCMRSDTNIVFNILKKFLLFIRYKERCNYIMNTKSLNKRVFSSKSETSTTLLQELVNLTPILLNMSATQLHSFAIHWIVTNQSCLKRNLMSYTMVKSLLEFSFSTTSTKS